MGGKRVSVLVVVGALALVLLSLWVASAWAGPDGRRTAPPVAAAGVFSDTISYQGRLLDASGNPVDGSRVMTFSLYADPSGGSALWSHSDDVPVGDGLLSVELPVNPTLFDGQALWLGVRVGGDAGEMSPRQPLLPAPYALFARAAATAGEAENADLLDGQHGSFYRDAGHLVAGTLDLERFSAYDDLGSEGHLNDDGDDDLLQRFQADERYVNEGQPHSVSSHMIITGTVLFEDIGDNGCAPDQVMRRTGGVWTCAPYGDIAAVIAGHGLQGGGDAGEIALSVLTSTIQSRIIDSCPPDHAIRVIKEDGSVDCELDDVSTAGNYWALVGNGGTDPGADFVGTSDPVSLTLAVDGEPALRLEFTGWAANLVGGHSANNVMEHVRGAVIGGGGGSGNPNQVTDDFGIVVGGQNNRAGDGDALENNAAWATVGGGSGNTAGGGSSTVSGGEDNVASTSGATVGGGGGNSATGGGATIGGGSANAAAAGATTIGGGEYISVANHGGTVAGGSWITVTGDYGAVGGGQLNLASGHFATIGGGRLNTAGNWDATVGGGDQNVASNTDTTVGGGQENTAAGIASTVSGGARSTAYGDYGAIGGGYQHVVSGAYGTVAGGIWNGVTTTYGTIGGGWSNIVTGTSGAIGGGYLNRVGGLEAAVGGGIGNQAMGPRATVGGGWYNKATGNTATVPGGSGNVASGAYSFAAGAGAQAIYQGSFVWSSGESTTSWLTNTFTTRAHGGVRFYTAGGTGTGAQLASGGSSWGVISDRAVKDNFAEVDSGQLLEALVALPVQTWNLRAQSPEMRHIGPVAQDFNGGFAYLFGEVESPVHINVMDAVGVSLAASQGLYAHTQAQAARLEALARENAALRHELDDLQLRVAKLEQAGNAGGSGPVQGGNLPGGWLGFAAMVAVAGVWAWRRAPKASCQAGNE